MIKQDKTITATITKEEVDATIQTDIVQSEAIEALERTMGTYESYGAFTIVRPNYSDKADLTRLEK